MCAAFASPRAAVDAAVTAQRTLELPVRMGIATGEAELRGADYFGSVLNRAARVMAAATGARFDRWPHGGIGGWCRAVALGSKRFRDIGRPVDVFQVKAFGLRPIPPLRRWIRPAETCGRDTAIFVGRERDLAELRGGQDVGS